MTPGLWKRHEDLQQLQLYPRESWEVLKIGIDFVSRVLGFHRWKKGVSSFADLETVRRFHDNLPEVEFDQAQYRVISSNMKVKWVLDEGHVVYARGGATRRTDHVIKDITEEKHAIDALRQSEAKYRDFFNSTSDMAFAISPDGVFIDIICPGGKASGGHHPGNREGHGIDARLPPERLQSLRKNCRGDQGL